MYVVMYAYKRRQCPVYLTVVALRTSMYLPYSTKDLFYTDLLCVLKFE